MRRPSWTSALVLAAFAALVAGSRDAAVALFSCAVITAGIEALDAVMSRSDP